MTTDPNPTPEAPHPEPPYHPKPPGIARLIAAIGDENIQVQGLAANMVNVSDGRDGAHVTFVTEPSKAQSLARQVWGNAIAGKETVGIVVWFSREKYDEAMKRPEPEPLPANTRALLLGLNGEFYGGPRVDAEAFRIMPRIIAALEAAGLIPKEPTV